MDYNFREIEKKWQAYWKDKKTYKTEVDKSKPKYYVLDMFPYPSGAGLHVGHPLGYIASDVIARYKRHKGFNVLHPMGFDAFGLPAEQYAIETGQHPAVTTENNIKRYKEQLENIGFSYDWDREVRTCDPEYYKWTQWIFLQLYNSWYNKDNDKAEPIETLIEKFKTNGTAGVNAVSSYYEHFTADQWKSKSEKEKQLILGNFSLAYLAYSDVNWCPVLGTVLANDEVKDGRSERGGHPVYRMKMRQWFLRITAYAERLLDGLDNLDWPDSLKEMQRNWIGRSEGAQVKFRIKDTDFDLEIFTTRPDTLFGATFMVLAPEHEMVKEITTPEQQEKVEKYLEYVHSRSDVERQQEKKVTGEFTGAYAIHPVSKEEVPIWVAEYVLAGYGTGAIMAVPSRDDRDHAFAQKFGLPIIEVIDQSEYPNADREDKVGEMINSDFLNGMHVTGAIETMLGWLEEHNVGSRRVNYKLRDAGFSRQRYWGEPFPVIYDHDVPYALDESELPVVLPEVESYKPTGEAKSPLAANTEWVKYNGCERETDTMPGYAGSSWYFLRYMDPKNENRFVGKDAEEYWQNVDFYIGGAEHAVGHLMYSRFWHKFLFDMGLIGTEEPFKKLINQGMIQGVSSLVYRIKDTNKFVSKGLKDKYDTVTLNVDISFVKDNVLDIERFKQWRDDFNMAEFELEDGRYICGQEVEKMSKSKYNVVNPDDIVETYGADCFRMYEMFLGPIEQSKPWDTKGIDGVWKFLKRLWGLYDNITDEQLTKEERKVLHKTIKQVQGDIERFNLNTVVSALMICVNELRDLNCNKRAILKDLAILVSPYGPHIAEELWVKLGYEPSVTDAPFPEWKQEYLVEDTFEYPVSFNGKMRFKLELPTDLSKEEIEKEVLSSEKSLKYMEGKSPKKVIVVPKRIVNVVV